jgi:hypothetical protein
LNLQIYSNSTAQDTSFPTQPKQSLSSETQNEAAKNERETMSNEQDERLICKIFLLNDLEIVFLPCGHQLSCNQCSHRLINCPICRQSIRRYVRTYFS